MTEAERYRHVLDWFGKNMPDAHTELHYNNPYELLVAVMLSAQCTDKRVNMVTPAFYAAYPNAEILSKATFDDVLKYVHSVSYPNSKAKHLIGMAQQLTERYGGEVPSELDELISLPGVGRKTANVVQSVVFGKATMAVDTHVFRVSHRIGLVSDKCTTPLAVEKELTKHIPAGQIPIAHHWFILHGRYTCVARNPKCDICGLAEYCLFRSKAGK